MINIGKGCELNLEKLIATRMLITANSGGGKSWAIRRILEQSHGKVQQIVIDLEGEFSTLREKYGYLLVGKDGEIPVSIRTAELLAKRLLELNVSTIIDLSELRHPERITFVKRFLDSLINSPKELWHPALIIVDEAHIFCPEKSKSESASAVIDLMTRGRKRGFAGILATQRISKLNKDAVAEANNYMMGRAGLDIDMKRTSEILGFVKKEDTRSLRELKAGGFYIFGSAFQHNGIEKVFVGKVSTTHPDRTRGIDIVKPTKTPDNIKKLMKDVVDLPKEAEEELKTTQDMKNKIRELRTKLTIAEKGQKVIERPEDKEKQLKTIERAREQGFRESERISMDILKKTNLSLTNFRKGVEIIVANCSKLLQVEVPKFNELPKFNPKPIQSKPQIQSVTEVTHLTPESKQVLIPNSSGTLRAGAMKMLNWLAGAYPNPLTKQRLATLSGFSVKGGTFNTYISELKRNGWIVGANDLSITNEGLQNSHAEVIPSREELLQMWKTKFRVGAGKILQFVYENYPNGVDKDEIGYAVGFASEGGTFNTYLSELRRNGLIQIDGNQIRISEEFFE